MKYFDEMIKNWLNKGVNEKIEEKNGNRKHYIPHHAITTSEKSTKFESCTTHMQKQKKYEKS